MPLGGPLVMRRIQPVFHVCLAGLDADGFATFSTRQGIHLFCRIEQQDCAHRHALQILQCNLSQHPRHFMA
jgi:hypothetical protein